MFYRVGTATFTHGSNIVTGVDTEWLTYVSKGAFIRKEDDVDYWVIQAVVSDTELTLTEPYLGSSTSDYSYTITTDKTPNLGLPIINKFDANPVDAINASNLIIDMAAGDILDYQNEKEITYSGESAFFVRGNYSQDHLCVGRTLQFFNSSDEVTGYDVIQRNDIFNTNLSGTPVAGVVTFVNSFASGELDIAKHDVVYNETRNNHAFIKTVDVSLHQLAYSGELIGTTSAWGDGDSLYVYAKTKGLAGLSAVNSSSATLIALSGESLALSEFKAGELLYNYTRDTYRLINSIASNVVATPETVDTWATNDVVYTVEAKIQTRTNKLTVSDVTVKSGSRVQIGSRSVKQSHIDWGTGYNQVDASDVPCVVTGLSATDVNSALQEVVNDSTNHLISGEAHLASAIRYSDSPTLIGPTLAATDVNSAINELKTYYGIDVLLRGVVDEATTTTVIDETFFLYDASFFSGEFFIRMDSGGTSGQLRKIFSFNAATAEFTISGESFIGTPVEGDQFSILRDDSWATREAFEAAFSSDSTALIFKASQVSAVHTGLFQSGETVQDFFNAFGEGTPSTGTTTIITPTGNLSGETAQDFFNQLGNRHIVPLHPGTTHNVRCETVYDGVATICYADDGLPVNLTGRKFQCVSADTQFNGRFYFGPYVSAINAYYIYDTPTTAHPYLPTAEVERTASGEIRIGDWFIEGHVMMGTEDPMVADFCPLSGEHVQIQPFRNSTAQNAQELFTHLDSMLGNVDFNSYNSAPINWTASPFSPWGGVYMHCLQSPNVNNASGETPCYITSSNSAKTGFYHTTDAAADPPVAFFTVSRIVSGEFFALPSQLPASGEYGTIRFGTPVVAGDVLTALSPTAFGFKTP